MQRVFRDSKIKKIIIFKSKHFKYSPAKSRIFYLELTYVYIELVKLKQLRKFYVIFVFT